MVADSGVCVNYYGADADGKPSVSAGLNHYKCVMGSALGKCGSWSRLGFTFVWYK